MAVGEEWGSISLLFENSILFIRVQGYRGLTEKLKTVKTVHTLRYGVLKISEYFRKYSRKSMYLVQWYYIFRLKHGD